MTVPGSSDHATSDKQKGKEDEQVKCILFNKRFDSTQLHAEDQGFSMTG
jgi:hypothetical protein